MTWRITDARALKVGDVVTVAVELPDKSHPGHTFWWKRFAVVVEETFREDTIYLLTLKLHPTENDLRFVDTDRDVVHLLPEDQWPQGVIAMRMKAIHMGWLKLD